MSTTTIEDQAQAIASLPPDLALLRMENDSIQALAAARPRDLKQIKADLAASLEQFPILAEDAIYNKPVGYVFMVLCTCGNEYEALKLEKESAQCPRCGNFQPNFEKQKPRRVQKYARNLSIRAAEALAEAYGFNRLRCDVTELPNDRVKIEATFVDFQKGRIWQDSGIVSPWYKSRSGTMQRIPEDRFYNVTLKAEKSKYIREVINRSVNQGLKVWFYDECEKIQDSLLDDTTVTKIISQFAQKGIDQDTIETKIVGRPRSSGWTTEDRKTLLGVWNALKDGELTVAELLRDEDDHGRQKPQSPAGAVSGSHLTKGATKIDRPDAPHHEEPAPPALSDADLDDWKKRIAAANNPTFCRGLEDQAMAVPMPDRQQLLDMIQARQDEIRAARGDKQAEKGKLI